jgi:hypothetical protein
MQNYTDGLSDRQVEAIYRDIADLGEFDPSFDDIDAHIRSIAAAIFAAVVLLATLYLTLWSLTH